MMSAILLPLPILALAFGAGGLGLVLVAGRDELTAQQANPEVVLTGDITAEQTAFGNGARSLMDDGASNAIAQEARKWRAVNSVGSRLGCSP